MYVCIPLLVSLFLSVFVCGSQCCPCASIPVVLMTVLWRLCVYICVCFFSQCIYATICTVCFCMCNISFCHSIFRLDICQSYSHSPRICKADFTEINVPVAPRVKGFAAVLALCARQVLIIPQKINELAKILFFPVPENYKKWWFRTTI